MMQHAADTSCISTSNDVARLTRWVLLLAFVQGGLYAVLAELSTRFDYHTEFRQRPILLTICLLTVCFALHLLGLSMVLRMRRPAVVMRFVVIPAIAFRVILLASSPIQEVDIYRYLWDGASLAAGVSPYRYSPEQARRANEQVQLPPDLRRLVEIQDESASVAETLHRTHYGELTTVYPPVSQIVFAAAAVSTPRASSLPVRMLIMKAYLALFDVGTLVLVMWLLHTTGRHLGWAIAYGWSPLVLKEFANSGHLDSIAVFLTTAAIACWIRGLRAQIHGRFCLSWALAAGLLLGLAIGAKLYPIVLLPLLSSVMWRSVGIRKAACLFGMALATTGLTLAPMLCTVAATTEWSETLEDEPPALRNTLSAESEFPPDEKQPRSGLITFLSRWEINDLPFMFVLENLRPTQTSQDDALTGPWFVIVPINWRMRFDRLLIENGLPIQNTTFLVTRIITLILFTVIALHLARQAANSAQAVDWLRAAFLTLAWFWALSPTMNPWYWIWAVPLLPFARSRAWFSVAACLPLYYLRFWLSYHAADQPVLGTPYLGEEFFHFVIVPIEHGVWLLWLLWEGLRRDRICSLPPKMTPTHELKAQQIQ